MSRTMTSPYAIATILLLTLGLVVTRFTRMQTATIAWRSASYGFTWQTPCYGLAAFFCVYAFLTSIGYIPFSPALSKWHFWVSAASILGDGGKCRLHLGQACLVSDRHAGRPGTGVRSGLRTGKPAHLLAGPTLVRSRPRSRPLAPANRDLDLPRPSEPGWRCRRLPRSSPGRKQDPPAPAAQPGTLKSARSPDQPHRYAAPPSPQNHSA
jgi:hypothetical protein